MQVAPKVKIPILTYHSIDKSGSIISTAPDVFRRQMRFLSESNYNVVTLNELTTSLVQGKAPQRNTIALTFDDGFQNFLTAAFPVLDSYGFKATVFLVTDYCGQNNEWAGNPRNFPLSKILSWDEVKELHKHGIEFGNHTRTHPDLTKITDSSVRSEIVESKAIMEDMLGNEVGSFAYPFGKFNSSVRQIVKNEYRAACSTSLGKVESGSDFFSLERIDAYYLSNPKIFKGLSSAAFDKYILFRKVMRDVRAHLSRN